MTESIFDIPFAELKQWGPGERLDHSKLNQPVDALNRLRNRGVRPPQQNATMAPKPAAVATGASLGGTAFMKVMAVAQGGDVLRCVPTDIHGNDSGGAEVLVAMPWSLRRTPFDQQSRAGITYGYTSDTQRVAVVGGDTQTEVRVPSYVNGDVIVARHIGAATFTVNGEPQEVSMFDTNDAGREWAKVGE